MNKILLDYDINQRTMVLIPVRHIEYNTIVLERDRQLFVKKTPIQLMKTACLKHCSTYQGRRDAVMHHTNFKRKVPIPISISNNLYSFPTHSTTDFDCHWIFSSHIQSIKRISSGINSDAKSVITFKNAQQLPLNVSCHIIEKQIQRTLICKFRFSNWTQSMGSDGYVNSL